MESLLVVEPKGHGVSDEILRPCFQAKFCVHILHRALVDIES